MLLKSTYKHLQLQFFSGGDIPGLVWKGGEEIGKERGGCVTADGGMDAPGSASVSTSMSRNAKFFEIPTAL